MPGKLVLCRHGQSEWNLKEPVHGVDRRRFDRHGSKWRQATPEKRSGALDYSFDIAFTSVLTRAVRTLWIIMDELDRLWLPVVRDWRLNERHYGALQGLNKAETAAKYGDDQVHIWRRSYSTLPPPLEADDERHPRHDPRYAERRRTAGNRILWPRRSSECSPAGSSSLNRRSPPARTFSSPRTATACARWSKCWTAYRMRTSPDSTFRPEFRLPTNSTTTSSRCLESSSGILKPSPPPPRRWRRRVSPSDTSASEIASRFSRVRVSSSPRGAQIVGNVAPARFCQHMV